MSRRIAGDVRDRSRFKVGSGLYTCRSCGKRTRETGSGESSLDLCRACFEYSGWENTHSDDGHEDFPDPNDPWRKACPICRGKKAPWEK